MSSSRGDALHADASYILQSQHITSDALTIQDVTTLPELFKWQAQRRNGETLFTFRSSPDAALTTVSYAEAYERTSQLAESLHSFHSSSSNENESPVVGIWLERSIELHFAILATTISGATWLPFDADVPTTRVSACLEDSKACILLCDTVHYDSAIKATENLPGCQVITFDALSRQTPTRRGAVKDVRGPSPHHTAYLIYTSGSTGTPKGIEIPHSAALTFCLSERSVLETRPEDIVWQGFSAAFDMFIEEVWVSIAGGAQLAIGNRSECQDVPSLGGAAGVWTQRGVTIVNAVPTLINIMTSLDDDCRLPTSVRLLNLGGEACPPALVNHLWTPSLRIFNTYGPSETTVTATFQELFPNEPVTIGKPLPMYHAMILPILEDSPKEKVWSPIPFQEGTEGELAIGGPCLGKGYVQRPTLTAEKFITHPLHPNERLYRTGDLVRLDKNHNIVYLGRIDTQVKHRGFRIELGEIENAISSHPKVQTTAVILSTSTDCLEAYMVTKDDEILDTRELRNTIRHLPAYMQPEGFCFVPAKEMPRLPSGKINAKALQETSAQLALAQKEELGQQVYAGTSIPNDGSDLSILLLAMLELFPQAPNITASSDFFHDLGGHSLLAAKLVSKLRKGSPKGSSLKKLGLQDIYIYCTAEKIAASLAEVTDTDGRDSFFEKADTLNSQMNDHWPVSRRRYVLCGIAQAIALLLLFFIEGVTFLGPYLVFFEILQAIDLGTAVAVTYFVFVSLPLLRALIGIVGKWIVLGKAKAGEYPLYGVYYFRWWLADHLVGLIDMVTIADSALLPAMMRCMGARVGTNCHLGVTHIGAAFDLVSIGDDVTMGKDTVLSTSWVERGRLILAPVSIASQAHFGSNSVMEGDSYIEEGGELGSMSMLSQGCHVPAGERWIGSPARFRECSTDIGGMRASRPSEFRASAMILAMSLSSIFLLPIIVFAPQIPSMLLFDYINIPRMGWWAQTAIVSVPAALIYMILVFLELIVLRWLVLGKVVECSYRTTSVYFFRKWFVDRLMDMSLAILHPVYATLYVVPFLRSLGVKIGRRAEVSTARGINFELTDIGEECFIADGVFIGDGDVRRNMVTLKKTKLHKRAFLGNASLVPQGTEMASNTLVGVLSCAPEIPLKEGESCFGSPPVLMPSRQCGREKHADHLLYTPRASQVALRLFIEGMRIVVPRIIVTFGLGFGVQVFDAGYNAIGILPAIVLLPFFYFFFFALPALLVTLACKWALIGHYRPASWPLWSPRVWLSEFVTSTSETLALPLLLNLLTGTPFLPLTFRLFGVHVGKRTTLLSNDITEFDMVTLGDEAVVNKLAGPQTHLFEDRVMKIGRVEMEERAVLMAYSIALPGSRVGRGARVGALSLVMKGESVPEGEAWEGAPIGRRRVVVVGGGSKEVGSEGSMPSSRGSS
ncbi:Non-ribosomal peptide synthetase C-terminal [Mollisia scopiformis]|uniref:Non-ribosomal peptide synthetase C-terminal n=1 Tax=Mollisia scopiformis TaxID=149040 RepID=A0A194XH01_MOLSC|nr:Non-ribosomal peptide synthetase C-terminal [Mollisia scopiformis]KUJ19409.1 Non-ribosomal peptide synthetase C-terminal [Mollisia scopiformis]